MNLALKEIKNPPMQATIQVKKRETIIKPLQKLHSSNLQIILCNNMKQNRILTNPNQFKYCLWH